MGKRSECWALGFSMFRGEELKSEQKSTIQKETKRERWPKAKRAFHEGRPSTPSNAANMSGQRELRLDHGIGRLGGPSGG